MEIMVIIALVLALVIAQYIVYKRFALRGLLATIQFSTSVAHCGDTITISEKIENKKRLPLFLLILRFEAPRALHFPDMTNTALSDQYYREDLLSLGGWKRHVRHIPVQCKKRGFYELKRLSVTTSDPLMISIIYGFFPSTSTLTVLPRLLSTPDIDALFISSIGEKILRSSIVTNPFTFSGIREYQPWDSFEKINWSASARKGTFMVNTSHCTVCPEVMLIINVDHYAPNRNTDLIEKAISLAYSFASISLRDFMPISLFSNSRDKQTDEPIAIPGGSGREHVWEIGLSLARIDLTKDAMSFEMLLESLPFRQGETRCIVLSANTDTSLQAALLQKIQEGIELVWIIPHASHHPRPMIRPELFSHTRIWEARYET